MKNIRVVHDKVGCYSDWEISVPMPRFVAKHWHDYTEGKLSPAYPVPAIRCEVAIDHLGCTVYVDSFFTCNGQTLWDIVADSRVNHPRKRETI